MRKKSRKPASGCQHCLGVSSGHTAAPIHFGPRLGHRNIYGEPSTPCLFLSLFGFSFWSQEFKANHTFLAKPDT